MLILSRKINESITVDGPAKITIVGVHGSQIKVGIEADADVRIMRTELTEEEE